MNQKIIVADREEIKEILRELAIEKQVKSIEKEHEHDEMLSTKGLMEFLKASRQGIHNWVKRGIIPRRKIGKRNYFLKSEVIMASERLKKAGRY
jgi:predicted DNA-binding transcriptional regulator AlpA